MNVTLTPDQQAWINAHVATGEFESAQDAIHGRRNITKRLLTKPNIATPP
jgi:Arc/MetJ-type ribon-helix-helix transcriptional regulator